MVNPIISLAVVMNGPVAKAGSIFTRFKISGINAPNMAAIITTKNNEIPTVIPKFISPFKKYSSPKIAAEQMKPTRSPISDSFPTCLKIPLI